MYIRVQSLWPAHRQRRAAGGNGLYLQIHEHFHDVFVAQVAATALIHRTCRARHPDPRPVAHDPGVLGQRLVPAHGGSVDHLDFVGAGGIAQDALCQLDERDARVRAVLALRCIAGAVVAPHARIRCVRILRVGPVAWDVFLHMQPVTLADDTHARTNVCACVHAPEGMQAEGACVHVRMVHACTESPVGSV